MFLEWGWATEPIRGCLAPTTPVIRSGIENCSIVDQHNVADEAKAGAKAFVAGRVGMGTAADAAVIVWQIDQCKNVVDDDIVQAIVLVEAGALGVVGNVVLDADEARGLVGVVAPAAIVEGGDVGAHVVVNAVAGTVAQVVDLGEGG